MNLKFRRIIPRADLHRHLSDVAAASIVVGFLGLIAFPPTARADTSQYAAVARLDPKDTSLNASEIVVRVGDRRSPAAAIQAIPDIQRSIAIVMDRGPDQKSALSREKELAIALINEFSDGGTTFTIATAGTPSSLEVTLNQPIAIERIRNIAVATGMKANVPIYDPIGAAIRHISRSPGLRIVIFIGEGNDGGSRMRYLELRSLAESNQVAFFAALVADHSLRGTKGILRYGWQLRELSSETAGAFLENDRTPEAIRRLSENIRGLRLISFELPRLKPGRYKISMQDRQGKRLRSQNAIVIP